ncbi:hypothetical protein DACRYDRAFT_96870, partial [Dacryopinax primogenitus]
MKSRGKSVLMPAQQASNWQPRGTRRCTCSECISDARPAGRTWTRSGICAHLRHLATRQSLGSSTVPGQQPSGSVPAAPPRDPQLATVDDQESLPVETQPDIDAMDQMPLWSTLEDPLIPDDTEGLESSDIAPALQNNAGVDVPQESASLMDVWEDNDLPSFQVDEEPDDDAIHTETIKSFEPEPAVSEQSARLAVDDLRIALPPPPPSYDFDHPSWTPLQCYLSMHSNAAVRAICLMMVYLHARYQLPHRTCGFLASFLYLVLEYMDILSPSASCTPGSSPPCTLTTMYQRMGIWDCFEVKTICPICWLCDSYQSRPEDPEMVDELTYEEDPPQADWQRRCKRCQVALYERAPTSLILTTCKKAPLDLLSLQLADFLGQPGFEEACESYLDKPSQPVIYSGIQD